MAVFAQTEIFKGTLNKTLGDVTSAASVCLHSEQQELKCNSLEEERFEASNQTQLTDLCSCHRRCEVMRVHGVPVYSNFSVE